MWNMQQQQMPYQQQMPFHQQMPQQAGSAGQFPPSMPPPQQWSNLPAGFPILIPGPGGSLVPAGGVPQPPNDGRQPQEQPLSQIEKNMPYYAPQQQNEARETAASLEGDNINKDANPVIAQNSSNGSLKPLMTRAPTKRFVIGGVKPIENSNGEKSIGLFKRVP